MPRHPGDDGHSDLNGSDRPPKSSLAFQCLGWIDELTSAVGHLRVSLRAGAATSTTTPAASSDLAAGDTRIIEHSLRSHQQLLSEVMGLVASGKGQLAPGIVMELEREEQALRRKCKIGPGFAIPGDGPEASARADVARARCRTAERALVAYMESGPEAKDPEQFRIAQRFLNRFSDYLFVVARYLETTSEDTDQDEEG